MSDLLKIYYKNEPNPKEVPIGTSGMIKSYRSYLGGAMPELDSESAELNELMNSEITEEEYSSIVKGAYLTSSEDEPISQNSLFIDGSYSELLLRIPKSTESKEIEKVEFIYKGVTYEYEFKENEKKNDSILYLNIGTNNVLNTVGYFYKKDPESIDYKSKFNKATDKVLTCPQYNSLPKNLYDRSSVSFYGVTLDGFTGVDESLSDEILNNYSCHEIE